MRLKLLLFSVLILSGCSHTYLLPQNPETYQAEVETFSAKKNAHVVLKSHQTIIARNLKFIPPNLRLHNHETGSDTTAAIADISKIYFVYHGAGALGGFFKGLILGGAAGGLIGYISGKDSYLGPGVSAFGGAIYFGAIGTGLGILTGMIHGERLIYELSGDSARSGYIRPHINSGSTLVNH